MYYSSPRIALYLLNSLGKVLLNSSNMLALNLRYASILPLTCSFLARAFSIQSFVYNWGLRP